MADIEKVMYDLMDIKERNNLSECEIRTISDAVALLLEHEAVEPFHKCIGNAFSLIEDSHFDYCPYCGKPITWAKQEGR